MWIRMRIWVYLKGFNDQKLGKICSDNKKLHIFNHKLQFSDYKAFKKDPKEKPSVLKRFCVIFTLQDLDPDPAVMRIRIHADAGPKHRIIWSFTQKADLCDSYGYYQIGCPSLYIKLK